MRRISLLVFTLFLLSVGAVGSIGSIGSVGAVECFGTAGVAAPETPDILPFPGQVNPYRTRSELLMDATNYTGVFTPEAAADVWAEGLKGRSSALQYTVMTCALKREYAAQLDEQRSNWVAGQSSPWVQTAVIESIDKTDDTHAKIDMRFTTLSSSGPGETYRATLWLIREGDFWRIEKLATDEGLYVYTRFKAFY